MRRLTQAIHERRTLWERAASVYAGDSRVQVAQILLTLGACILFVLETYQGEGRPPTWFSVLEVVLTVLFATDFAVSLYVAEDRWRYVVSLPAIADLMSLLPVVSVFVPTDDSIDIFRVFRLFKAVRILRIHRVVALGRRAGQGDVFRRASMLVLSLFGMLFVSAAVVHFVENVSEESFIVADLPFHDAFYFVVVSFSTVGYGDIYPSRTASRLFMVAGILLSFVLIPFQARKLLDALEQRSPYAGSYRPPSRANHVLVCGKLSAATLGMLLTELLHPDHGDSVRWLRIVLLQTEPPDDDTRNVLAQPRFVSRVTYLVGQATSSVDLERAAADSAQCAFVMSSLTTGTRHDDADTILNCLSIQKYAPDVHIIAQVAAADSQRTLAAAGVTLSLSRDEFVVGLMAHSSLCPGLSTLVVNLGHSLSPLPAGALEDGNGWFLDFYNGASNEVYTVVVGTALDGVPFHDAVRQLYSQAGIVMLGVVLPEGALLNPPSSHRLTAGTRVYVIAAAQDAANAVLKAKSPPTRRPSMRSVLDEKERSTAIPHSVSSLQLVVPLPATPLLNGSPMAKPAGGTTTSPLPAAQPSGTAEPPTGAAVEEESVAAASTPVGVDAVRLAGAMGDGVPPHRLLSATAVETKASAAPAAVAGAGTGVGAGVGTGAGATATPSGADVDAGTVADSSALSPMSTARSRGRSPGRGPTAGAQSDVRRLLTDVAAALTRVSSSGDHRLHDAARHCRQAASHTQLALMSLPPSAPAGDAHAHTPEQLGVYVEACSVLPSNLRRHIVLTGDLGPLPSFVEQFVGCVRTQSLPEGVSPHLVIMTQDAVTATQLCINVLHKLAPLPCGCQACTRVYILKGDSTSRRDVLRCRPVDARSVVVLSQPAPRGANHMLAADSVAVLTSVQLRSCLSTVESEICHSITELVMESSFKFLDPHGEAWEPPPGPDGVFLWPSYAAGRVFTNRMLMPLLVSVFYSPETLYALKALLQLSGPTTQPRPESESSSQLPNNAAATAPSSRRVQLLPVPEDVVGSTVADLFLRLCDGGALMLGLYRAAGTHGSMTPYVLCNPPSATKIVATDRMYVLPAARPVPPSLPLRRPSSQVRRSPSVA